MTVDPRQPRVKIVTSLLQKTLTDNVVDMICRRDLCKTIKGILNNRSPRHYNFTEEELDFIINYDIKYRMGKELDSYIEGTLGRESLENEG